MIIRTISSVDGFKTLEPVWRELHAQSPDSSFFNGFDFAFVWWQLYGSLGELAIYVVEAEPVAGDEGSSGRVIAIAPLYKTCSKMTRLFEIPTLRFVGRGGEVTPDDLDVLLTTNETEARIAAELLIKAWQESAGIQRILLEDLPSSSRFYQMAAKKLTLSVENRESRLVATLPDTWAEFTQTLSRNTRKRIKNRRNRLQQVETLQLSIAEGREAMHDALSALETLHKSRHDHKEGVCAFHTSEYVKFHRALIDAAHDKKVVQYVVLKDEEQIVGVEYIFTHAGALLFYQTGFDSNYDSVSPGHNMMMFAIEQGIIEGMTSFDLLKGEYAYKQSYASSSVESITVSNYRSLQWRVLGKLLNIAKSF